MLADRTIRSITFKEMTLTGLSSSYSHDRPGECLALVNSFDRLELAVSRGNARAVLQAELHDRVVVEFEDTP